MRTMSEHEYHTFTEKYNDAKAQIQGREAKVQAVISTIEQGLDLIGISGVEDKLQVKRSRAGRRNLHIRKMFEKPLKP